MIVGGLDIFDQGTIAPGGRVDMDLARRAIASRLHRGPRMRQRIMPMPYGGVPVWIDDQRFRLEHHVRHMTLPAENPAALKTAVSQILSSPLDRGRPLWEMWFLDGFASNHFAIVLKTHHCVIDGVSGAAALAAILDSEPSSEISDPIPWQPRPSPSVTDLWSDEVSRRTQLSVGLVRQTIRALRDPTDALKQVRGTIAAVAEAVTPLLGPASNTPLNVQIGPNRIFECLDLALTSVKKVKSILGVTVNDVILATTSGGLRRFFRARDLDPQQLEIRAMVPMSLWSAGESGVGNRLSEVVVPLFVQIADPVERLRLIASATARLKRSGAAQLGGLANTLGEFTVPVVLAEAARLAQRIRPYNLIISNIQGAPSPLYFLGCKLLRHYPIVPIYHGLGVVVAAFSYDRQIGIGINADADALQDIDALALGIKSEFESLARMAKRASR